MATKTYDMKKNNEVNITVEGDNFLDGIEKVTANGNQLVVTLKDGNIMKFTNIANPDIIRVIAKKQNGDEVYNKTAQEFYEDTVQYLSELAKGEKITGSVFKDTIDVSGVELTKKVKDKLNPIQLKENSDPGVTINAGNGDDVITGSRYSDTITGGVGENIIKFVVDEATENFGNDTVNLTKGEIAHICIYESDGVTPVVPTSYSKGKNANDLLITTNKGTITVKNYLMKDTGATVTINGIDISKTPSMAHIDETYFDANLNKPVSSYTGTALADYVDASNIEQRKDKKGNGISTGVTVNTGLGDDIIKGSDFDDKINSGAGDDTIYSSAGNDTITGGIGSNTIIVKNEVFEVDTVNLTKGEDLTIDLSAYTTITTADKLKEFLSIDNKNLDINLGENGILKLTNFANTNVVGTGSVKALLYGGTEVDLNTQTIIKFNNNNLVKGAINGTRFSDDIKIENLTTNLTVNTKGGDNKVTLTNTTAKNTVNGGKDDDKLYLNNSGTTIAKLGEGENYAEVTGSGTNTIISGKENDEFRFSNTTATTTVQAGAGTNTINIDNSKDFGKITLLEEKKNASNIINLSQHVDDFYTFVKSNNTLIITNGKSLLQINDFFLNGGKYSTTEFQINGEHISFEDLLAETGGDLFEGSVMFGTDGNDKLNGSKKNELIFSSGGEDTVTGGQGDDTIYINGENGGTRINYDWASKNKLQNNGHDVIYGSSNKDTLYINIGSPDVTQEFVRVNDDLVIEFYNGHVDTKDKAAEGSVTIKNYYAQPEADRLDNLIIHSDANSGEDDVLNKGDNNLSLKTVYKWYLEGKLNPWREIPEQEQILFEGTEGDDNIVGNDVDNLIYGNGGHDTITGGKGNDTIDLTGSEGSTIKYVWAEGHELQGHGTDDVIGASEKDTLWVNVGSAECKITLIQDESGKDLTIGFNDTMESVTFKNYFTQDEDKRINTLIIHSDVWENDKEYSISELYEEGGLYIGNIVGTNGDDKGEATLNGRLNKDNDFYGFAGDDQIYTLGGKNNVWGGVGNDTIHINDGDMIDDTHVVNQGTTVYFDYTANDGKDVIYGATSKDTLNITLGGQDVPMRFINYQTNLVIVFAASDALDDTENIFEAFKNSITIRDYFKTHTGAEVNDGVLDKVIIDGVEKSLATLINQNYGVIFENNTGIDKPTTVNRIPDGTISQVFSHGANIIYANDEGNSITCNDGDDIVYGGAGNDTVDGGTGSNTIYGYNGDDKIYSGCLGQTEITGGKGDDNIIITNFAPSLGLNADQIAGIDEETGEITAYADIDGNVHPSVTRENYETTKVVGYIVEDNRSKGKNDIRFDIDNVKVYGGQGNDQIHSVITSGTTIDAGEGNDYVSLMGTNNTIIGGKGNDRIRVDSYSVAGNHDSVNTIIFNKGDGQDIIQGWTTGEENTLVKLKFADSNLSDLCFEKFGTALKIKYNSGEDSILIGDYYTENEWTNIPSFTLVDANDNETSLDDFIMEYGAIPISTETTIVANDEGEFISTFGNTNLTAITGGNGDDTIQIDNLDNLVVTGGAGNDTIKSVATTGTTVDGGVGNDYLSISGTNNTIIGGQGNDSIRVYFEGLNSENTLIFNKGDGQDIIQGLSNEDALFKLKFTDSDLSDLCLEKYGTALKIKYNSGADSVIIKDYYSEDEWVGVPSFSLIDSNNNETSLEDFITEYGAIPISTETTIVAGNDGEFISTFGNTNVATITGGNGDDDIRFDVDNVMVYGGEGNDKIHTVTTSGTTIDGGAGNDYINIMGDNNTISGGIGNDRIYVQSIYGSGNVENTLIFNKGDGNDVVQGMLSSGDNVVNLQFADSKLSDLYLEKYGTALRINYNLGRDSVLLENYFTNYDDILFQKVPIYTIITQDGTTSLEDFIATYDEIPNAYDTKIVGTSKDNYLNTYGNTNITSIIGNNDGVVYFDKDMDARFDAVKVNYDYTNGGDGHDTITVGYDVNYRREQQLDSIYINLGSEDVTLKNLKLIRYEGDVQHQDLVIQFYDANGKRDENNSITIKDYFTRNADSRLKHVFVDCGNGFVEREDFLRVLEGLDEHGQPADWTTSQDLYMHVDSGDIRGSFGDDNIYIDNGAHDRIIYDCITGGTDTIYNSTIANRLRINYNGEGDLTFECQRRREDIGKEYDLEINFYRGGDQNKENIGNIILKDYFKQNEENRITTFYINDDEEEHKVSFEDAVANLDNNGEIPEGVDFILNNQDPVYNFNLNHFDGKDNKTITIAAEGEERKSIVINGFSVADRNLSFDYDYDYVQNEQTHEWERGERTDGIVIRVEDENEQEDRNDTYSVRYVGALNEDEIIITDKNKTYHALSFNNPETPINWSQDYNNHVAFIQDDEGLITLISNNKTNIINTADGAGLDYTYGGGQDLIYTSDNSNDVYNVALTTSTSLSINDKGGADVLNVNTNIENVRLFFVCDNQGHIEDDIFIIHKDSFDADTIIPTVSGETEWGQGIIRVDANTDAEGFGIETVNAYDSNNVNTNAWAMVIAHDVATWLNTKGCESIPDAFEQDKADDTLFACFQSYGDAMAKYNANPQMYQMG